TNYGCKQIDFETDKWFNSKEFKVEVQNRMALVGGMKEEKLPIIVMEAIKLGGQLIN
ncbi:hypothetical protein CVH13_00120, partial [Dehalococcoides mccartyi]